MFTDDNHTKNTCPQTSNKDIRCRRAEVLQALDGVKVSYQTLGELRSVLYEVCRFCVAENKER